MTSVQHRSVGTFLVRLVLACLLPGLLGAALILVYEYRDGRTQLEKDTLLTARAMVQAVDAQLMRGQAVAQALATSDALHRGDFEHFHAQAREFVARNGIVTNVVLLDAGGRQLLNTLLEFGRPLAAPPDPDRVSPVFETGRPLIADVFLGPVAKKPIMAIYVPVRIAGRIRYVLGVGILPEHFNAILQAQRLPAGWIASVLDGRGAFVARTLDGARHVGQLPRDEFRERLLAMNEGTIDTTSVEGVKMQAAFTRSSVSGWRVAIGIPRSAIAWDLWRPLLLLAAGMAMLTVLGLLAARRIGGRIAHAFAALKAPATALGRGEAVAVPALDITEANDVATALSAAGDLLEQRSVALQAREAELREAHRLARIGTWHWDLRTGAVQVSDSIRDIYGREVPDFPAQRGTLLTVESWERVAAAADAAVREGKGYDLELDVNHGNGERIVISAKCEALRDAQGSVVALRGAIQDITERKRAENRVRDAALHDPLTGLPNRAFVFEYCERMLAAARRGHGRGALLFVDLDRFKPINDLHGHAVGDALLQEVARRLATCTRREDLVGRLGGDEFVIVLPRLDPGFHRAAVVAQHVVDRIREPFTVDGIELSISPSVGIAHFPDHAHEVSALIHAADMAMYKAKQSGRANFQFYSPDFDRAAEEALLLELQVRHALRHGGLRVHYQPVVDIHSGRLIGAEALVRMVREDGETVGPAAFIPVAEAAGLIGEIGHWVATEACRQLGAWAGEGLKMTMAVNVSPLQFRQRSFAEALGGIIDESGIDPSDLVIEVTESTLMDNVDDAVQILQRIKSLGVKVALDDFGTGYSSLASLSNLPLDKLKVDQSFVRRIERDEASRAVTEAIIALGRSLRLEIVGEGIESENALRYLRHSGCNQAQGYWFSQPLPPQDFARWCHERWGRRADGVAMPA